ncbi:hypothetical protein VTK73DRAFT_410 [Phialemonium thermophilum]|uniref:DUF676 domain-containing protein n=1 Tax=Phialemonium thermophilum TaxID=223376 RepID=A0ABR3XFI1_9PEZI
MASISQAEFERVASPSSFRSHESTRGGPPDAKVPRSWSPLDPRSSSSQSLDTFRSEENDHRRRLLVIYIHGFMGNDSSFRSFPAHVHHVLRNALADSHTVHSKIYPRYKTYKTIEVARDNFSKWLEPHESRTTDVVLVGHSMGGLLSADVVLMQSLSGTAFRHGILGTVSLDSPFLGLHPGVIVSGISSIFRPAASPTIEREPNELDIMSPAPLETISSNQSISNSSFSSAFPISTLELDSSFNPPFFNDTIFQDRGFLRNVAHFAEKHQSENLFEAARDHVMNHLEFGGCLADYPSLFARYNRLVRLDDENEPNAAKRVRFVNYYTISTGRPKKPKKDQGHVAQPPTQAAVSDDAQRIAVESVASPQVHFPDVPGEDPVEDSSDDGSLEFVDPIPEVDEPEDSAAEEPAAEEVLEGVEGVVGEAVDKAVKEALQEALDGYNSASFKTANASVQSTPDDLTAALGDLHLPAIPDLPEPPVILIPAEGTDKEIRRQAEKEAKRAAKVYEQAVKNREKALKERAKLVEKHERKLLKDAERREKKDKRKEQKEAKQLQKIKKEEDRRRSKEEQKEKEKDKESKKPKQRKFCLLPRTDQAGNDKWVPIRMEGVDEVGAHCGLFFPGPHYEALVNDVGSRIVTWVHEANLHRITTMPVEEGNTAPSLIDPIN